MPSRIDYSEVIGQRRAECLVYFDKPVHEFEAGLEALYSNLLTLEAAIIDAATTGSGYFCQYRETMTDEDRVDGYKLMALRVVVDG